MPRCVASTLFALIVSVFAAACIAVAGDGSCVGLCPTCGEKVCVTSAKPGKETRDCWEVECVEVCIPPVRFPWECCDRRACDCCDACGPCVSDKCGQVRCVRRLRKEEYECDVCEYEHTIVFRCPHCDAVGDGYCIPPAPLACDAEGLMVVPPAVAEPQPVPVIEQQSAQVSTQEKASLKTRFAAGRQALRDRLNSLRGK